MEIIGGGTLGTDKRLVTTLRFACLRPFEHPLFHVNAPVDEQRALPRAGWSVRGLNSRAIVASL
jgi:hypothetical protein